MSVDSDDEMFDRAKLAQMAASMTPEVRANIVHQAEEIIPMMHKEDIKNIVADEEDEVFKCSEEMTFEWIEMFLSDVNRIERFFTDKKEQLINEFIVMQEKFRLKSNQYENKKKFTQKKQKNSNVNVETNLINMSNDGRASIIMDDHDFFEENLDQNNMSMISAELPLKTSHLSKDLLANDSNDYPKFGADLRSVSRLSENLNYRNSSMHTIRYSEIENVAKKEMAKF